MNQIKLLIIDDSPDDQELYERYLRSDPQKKYIIKPDFTGMKGLSMILVESPDCIMLDNRLPDIEGLEILNEINKIELKEIPPILFLTGQGCEEIAVEAMKRGASDYLVKSNLSADLLTRSIRYVMEKKESEIKLNDYYKQLEETVQRRTQELTQTNEALLQAKLEAEAAANGTKKLLSRFTHELLEPMNSIIVGSKLIMDKQSPDKTDHMTRNVNQAAKDLLRLIQNILNLSEIETEKMSIESKKVQAKHILYGTIAVFEAAAQKKQIPIDLDVHANTPSMFNGDEKVINQVLSNLMDNAIKFTGNGGKIVLGLEPIQENDNPMKIKFYIKDTGIGISPKDQKKIFDPFFQVDSSLTKNYPGMGVGLFVCSKLVEMMHGTIGVESEINTGSTFYFIL